MGKFDRVLIFSDIDGTYIAGHNTVPANDAAVRYFASEGGSFTFATGRMEKNVPLAIPNVAEIANFPVLLSNGAVMYDFKTDTRSDEQFMESDTVAPLMEYAIAHYPTVGIRATVPGGFWYTSDHPLVLRDLSRTPDCSYKLPFSEWNVEGVYKIVFRGDAETLERMQTDITERFGERLMIIMSELGILEAQRKDVSKGSAIERIREKLRAAGTPKTIVCIGDYENDLEMLRAADLAACPDNALPSVKAVSHITLCDCKDGAIAHLIAYLEEHPELFA